MTEQFANFAQSTLGAPISATQTTISVASATTFPLLGNFRIVVQSFETTTMAPVSMPELMIVTAVAGNTFTVQRGAESTTAMAFPSGSQVSLILTAGVMKELSGAFDIPDPSLSPDGYAIETLGGTYVLTPISSGGSPAGPTNSVQTNNGSGGFSGSANLLFDGNLETLTANSLGVTQDLTKGLKLTNITAAATGAQQMSPAIHWSAQGWKTTATAASESVDFIADVLPVQGSAAPTAQWKLKGSVNGAAFSDIIIANTNKTVTFPGGNVTATVGFVSSNYMDGNLLTRMDDLTIYYPTSVSPVVDSNLILYARTRLQFSTYSPSTPTNNQVWYDGTHIQCHTGGVTTQLDNQAGTTYTAGTGLTLTTGTFSVNTSQNISTLSNLTGNGFVKTTGGTGALSIDTTSYQPAFSNFTSTQVLFGNGTSAPAQSSRFTFDSTTGKTLITANNGGDYGLKVQGGRIYVGGDASGADFGIFGKDASSNLFFDANVVGGNIGFYTNDGSGNTAKLFITASGAITTGLWNATVIAGQYGGTGSANTGKTITLGGNLTTSGAFASTFTMTAATTVTFPTAGTLATLAGTETFTNKTGTSSTNTWFTLTTIGTGAATYTGNVLNIPTPTGGGGVSSITGTTNQVIASASTGVVTLSLPQSIATTSNVTFGSVTLGAGTSSQAPVVMTSSAGTLTSTATLGSFEYEGVEYYGTIDSTSGRGAIPVEQYLRLSSGGSTITTIANFFGGGSNISLVSGATYEIEIEMYYLKTTGGTATFTFTNSAAPTAMNMEYTLSPLGGVQSTQTATYLKGNQFDVTGTAPTITTGTLTSAANHFAKFKFFLINGTGTSLKIQATSSVGSITAGIGSYWKCRRLPASSTGNFAA